MLRRFSPNCAGLSAVLTSLLAVTTLTLGSSQTLAQKSAHPLSVKATPVAPIAPTTMTPSAVLNGGAIRVGHLEPTQKLHVVLSIQPPHMPEEEQFINELMTKGSPNFHKFLTPEQWNARFAPSAEDEQKVVAWAESQGLTVTKRYPNRLLVEADGTVDAVEKAFSVTMNKYQVGNEVDFSNDREPFIPSALTGIVRNVLGLSNVEHVIRTGVSKSGKKLPLPPAGPLSATYHINGNPAKAPANRAAARQQGTSASAPTPSDSFPLDGGVADPDSIQSSQGYDFNALQRLSHCCNEWGQASGSPPESSIALIGYGNFNWNDAVVFFNTYGMAGYVSTICITNGGSGSTCPGLDGEAPLDVEYAGAMSNSYGSYLDTAHIYEYEMGDSLYSTYAAAFNRILSDNVTRVVSTSYGWQENVGFSGSVATGTMHPIFNNMLGTGFTLVGSSGDSGSTVGCTNANSLVYPTSDPDFIAAGGTQLLLNSDGTFNSENAWEGEFWSGACGSNHGGGTGGKSVLFAAPSWQSAMANTFYGYSGGTAYDGTEWVFTNFNARMVPDLSLTANPDVMGQWYYAGGSWQDEGGTSIVAPELAGFFAQENSYLDYIGNVCGSGSSPCSPVGNAAPFIYADGNSYAPHNPFYDTTNGCDSNDITSFYTSLYYWCAYTGWDPATGWGSANMMQLAWGINWWLIPASGTPSLAMSGPSTNVWYNTDQYVSWSLSDSGGSYPAPGVAGFTQGWDSIPSDPTSEPHGGDGNSFYWGPQYPFASAGCLSFNGGFGCAGGSGQGCHTAYVEGWDNQGRTTTNSYGPVCFDNVAPTISVSNSPAPNVNGWWHGGVQVTLTRSDATSGVYATWYTVDNGSCYPGSYGTCTVYSGPFTFSTEGTHYIYYFTEDYAGNFSAEPYEYLYIDTVKPVTTPSLSGTVLSGSTYNGAVQVTLNASDATSGVYRTWYVLDGAPQVQYTSPFTVSTLGGHTIHYWSVDYAGNNETHGGVSFTVHSATTTALASSVNPSTWGQSVTLTATVTAALSGTPTGTVTFKNGPTTLGSASLSGGVASLSTTALPVGALTLKAFYAGAGNYIGSNGSLSQTVNKVTPVITWPVPAAITYGTLLSSTQLNASATIGGTFVYTPAAGTKLGGGWRTLSVTFTPTDTTHYATATMTRSIHVLQATPTITWSNPAPITHGTPLSSTQLNAVVTGLTSHVLAGTSTYFPAAGTVLGVGTHTLKVVFVPTDSTDFKQTSKTVSITVN